MGAFTESTVADTSTNPFRRNAISYSNPEPSHASRSSIDSFAEGTFNKLKLSPGFDLMPLIERAGGTVHSFDYSGWNNTHSGSIIYHGKNESAGKFDFDIIIANFEGVLRKRFTLAHELGHLLLHTRQGNLPIIAPRFISGIQNQSEEGKRAEWEANWFAAAFLMPATLFKEQFKRYKGKVTDLSSYFLVSEQAVQIRKDTLHLT